MVLNRLRRQGSRLLLQTSRLRRNSAQLMSRIAKPVSDQSEALVRVITHRSLSKVIECCKDPDELVGKSSW